MAIICGLMHDTDSGGGEPDFLSGTDYSVELCKIWCNSYAGISSRGADKSNEKQVKKGSKNVESVQKI